MKYKYSILTFIIGKGYETLHEIDNKQDDVEYICVTDDPDLKSETWNVVCDKSLDSAKSAFEKCFLVRYNVFKYCTTDICVTIDGSMHVKGSLDKLIDKFNSENYDICLMPHPLWPDFNHEYGAWIRMRKYPIKNTEKFFKMLASSNYNLGYKGLFQLCFSIKRRNAMTQLADDMTFNFLKYLSIGEDTFERLDQTVYTYVMNNWFNTMKVLPVSEQVVRSYAIQWYWHHNPSDPSPCKPNMNVFYDINKPDVKFVFNREVECYYLK